MKDSFIVRLGLFILIFLAASFPTRPVIVSSSEPHSPSYGLGNLSAMRVNPQPVGPPEPSEPLYPAWWGAEPKDEPEVPCKDPGTCAGCHESSARMDASHALACVRCHGGDPSAEEKEKAHTGLITDPGDLGTVDRTCGKCHPEEARRVKRSPMALAPRMINHTRFAFGAQKTSGVEHAARDLDDVKQVPHPEKSGNLGDDLLRRSCLRCHLHTRGSSRWGEHRGLGCSACHAARPNSAEGKPRSHGIVRNAGITACLKCHNANHVGGDFVGLFEKDFQRGFVSPFEKGRQPLRIYGAEQHRLSPDIHFRAGMQCVDCHSLDEIHGTGEMARGPGNNVKTTCESCYVRGDHPAILNEPSGKRTLMRGEGRPVPPWNAESVPHRVAPHRERLRCSACHAAWSYHDYGLHLMLEERADYWKWAPTAGQNDPQVQEILRENVGTFAEFVSPPGGEVPAKPEDEWKLPMTRDWLSGEVRRGAWFRGYTLRRWSRPALGLDSRKRVSIMRPMYQYVVSHVDGESNLLADRVIPTTGGGFPALIWNPYAPHTIAKPGRACHECHGEPKAAGLGEGTVGIAKPGFKPLMRPEEQVPGQSFRWDALVDDTGRRLQYSTHPEAGPLDAETVLRLLRPSPLHRAQWLEYLRSLETPQP